MVDRLPIVALVVFGAAAVVPAQPFDELRAVPGRVEAQEPQRGGAPGGPGGGPGAGFAIFAALDGDHDNTLSASEIAGAASALKALDKNGDGKVTADEFPAGRGGPGGRGGRGRGGSGVGDEAPAAPTSPDELADMLMAFDANKDGKLTTAEVPERLRGVFARADDNKDGILTPDEIKKAAAAQPQPTAAGRGREGGREGEGRGAPRPDPVMTALDQDHDGVLSADEIAAAPANLKKLDTDGDGALTLPEVFGGGRGRG